jgi:hypothetical protein
LRFLTTFTVSREDVYDYSRCPKIVAIKIHRGLRQPEDRGETAQRTKPEVSASVVGKIGEAAVAAVFSPEAMAAGTASKIKELVTQRTESAIADYGVVIDENTRRILEETVAGLTSVREVIANEFGEVEVIGRGKCKNGPFPGEALPDFVARTPKYNQPILIEVKNTPKPVKTDHFQASFYNTVARETGVVVHEQWFESGKLNLIPVAYHQSIAETMLIYPRNGSYDRVVDQVSLKSDTIKEIWRAKQLGLLGKTPHTDCDSKCPHHRLGIELPEGNFEPAWPPSLIFAQGLTEAGANLDDHYLHHYFYSSGIGTEMWLWTFKADRDPKLKAEVIRRLASKTNIPEDLVERMAFGRGRMPDPNKVLKEMSSDFQPWERILGKDRMSGIGPTLQRLVTRFYSLPERSEEYIKRSRKKWE